MFGVAHGPSPGPLVEAGSTENDQPAAASNRLTATHSLHTFLGRELVYNSAAA